MKFSIVKVMCIKVCKAAINFVLIGSVPNNCFNEILKFFWSYFANCITTFQPHLSAAFEQPLCQHFRSLPDDGFIALSYNILPSKVQHSDHFISCQTVDNVSWKLFYPHYSIQWSNINLILTPKRSTTYLSSNSCGPVSVQSKTSEDLTQGYFLLSF